MNEGTSDHMVPKGRKGRMAFRPGYTRKTRVGRIASSGGGAHGPRIVRHGQWIVRGIEARKYDELIAAKNQPVLNRKAQAALNAALTK
jgi:hypothetical protein